MKVKYVLYSFLSLGAIILVYLIVLSILSRYKAHHGLINGELAQCPKTPNCICSEPYNNQNFKPLRINLTYAHIEWRKLKASVVKCGGEILQDDGNYMWATFVTPFFRFVDDFEARLDTVQACIHLRSASRVGSYDFGTNLERINCIIENYLNNKRNLD